MVAPGIYHVKARLVDLIGSSGIENATSAQPKNLASAPRLSPLRFFGGVAGDETMRPHPLLSCDCYRDELTATFDPTKHVGDLMGMVPGVAKFYHNYLATPTQLPAHLQSTLQAI